MESNLKAFRRSGAHNSICGRSSPVVSQDNFICKSILKFRNVTKTFLTKLLVKKAFKTVKQNIATLITLR
jgi:hypothetical protein